VFVASFVVITAISDPNSVFVEGCEFAVPKLIGDNEKEVEPVPKFAPDVLVNGEMGWSPEINTGDGGPPKVVVGSCPKPGPNPVKVKPGKAALNLFP